jgi:hypothetical protein
MIISHVKYEYFRSRFRGKSISIIFTFTNININILNVIFQLKWILKNIDWNQ